MISPLKKPITPTHRKAKMDPGQWLASHGVNKLTPIEMGADALSRYGNDIVSAMSSESEIATEIAIAYILDSPDVSADVRQRIQDITDGLDIV